MSGLVVMVMVNFCVCVRDGWVMVMGDARFSRNPLKFAKCPYWCLITALVFRGVSLMVIRQLLHLLLLLLPWCFRGVNRRT